MKCDDVRAALQNARYGEEIDTPTREHIATCNECTAYEQRAVKLDALLDLDENEAPRPGFDTRFFARLEEEKSQRTAPIGSRWLRWIAAGLAIPAAITAAVIAIQSPTLTRGVVDEPTLEQELSLAMELEFLEDYEVVAKLDEVEAFELLAQVGVAELDAMLAEGVPQ